jgi:hypothetical protein
MGTSRNYRLPSHISSQDLISPTVGDSTVDTGYTVDTNRTAYRYNISEVDNIYLILLMMLSVFYLPNHEAVL